MYITIKSIKKTLGKFIELSDLYIGLPLLFIFLIMFALTNLKVEALILLAISGFLLLPVSVSKKNRMYKVLFLLFRYLIKTKEYCYFNEEENSRKRRFNEIFKQK